MFLKYKFTSDRLLIQTIADKYDSPVNECTHSWILSVQCKAAKKVTVDLHESFTLPTRELEKNENGIFELKSEGWGEFEMQVNIFMHKSNKKITIPHKLILIGNHYPVVNKMTDCIIQKKKMKRKERERTFEKSDDFLKIERVACDILKLYRRKN